jgi:hypothetical protein
LCRTYRVLDESRDGEERKVTVTTCIRQWAFSPYHILLACEDEVIPGQERIEAIGDEADLQESTTPSVTSSA